MSTDKSLTVTLYDNGGETLDRYTAIFVTADGESWYIGMSEHPFHPQGFGQHGEGDVSGTIERDREIAIGIAPVDVRMCIRQEIEAYYAATPPTADDYLAGYVTIDKLTGEARAAVEGIDATGYRSQCARDAARSSYGNESYWQSLDRSSLDHRDYYLARGDRQTGESMMTQSLGHALMGNDGD